MMRRIFAATWAATIVLAGACLPTSAHADPYDTNAADVNGDESVSIQSWSDLRTRYDGFVDRVASTQKSPSAIGGGPMVTPVEEDVILVYRTPSSSDGFWTDFVDRYDRSIDTAVRGSPRAAP